MEEFELSSDEKELLKKINFIAICPPGKKVSLVDKRFVEPNGWSYGNLKRSIFENRNTLLQHIEFLINSTYDILREQNNKDIIEVFNKALKDFEKGIRNLMETYKDEPDFVSSISVNIISLEALIRNTEEKQLQKQKHKESKDKIKEKYKDSN